MRIELLLGLACALHCVAVATHAQSSSTNFRLAIETINTGGGGGSSATFALFGCLAPGPDGGGVSSSASFRMSTGCSVIAAPSAGCGNGVVELPEACDDTNTADGDGCSSSCEVQEGWICSGSPSDCVALATSTPTTTPTSTPTTTPTLTPTRTPTVGCSGAPVGQACDDGLGCNGTDTCDGAGSCALHSGTPCDDADPCTQDTCTEPGSCQHDVVVESRACGTCLDETDNDSDGDVDADDSGCSTLSESMHFAIVGRAVKSKSVFLGGQILVDPTPGSIPDSTSPFPLGPSRAGVCGASRMEILAGVQIAGPVAAAAGHRFKLGTGTDSNFGEWYVDAPTTERIALGMLPVVGPGQCTANGADCTLDTHCNWPVSTCEGLLLEPGNPRVDGTGTHEEFLRCSAAKAALATDEAQIFALSGQTLPTINYKGGAQPIAPLVGPGPHVLRIDKLRVAGNTTLVISADDPDAVVVIQVERSMAVGKLGNVVVGDQLKAENLLWVAHGKGTVKVLGASSFAGVVLAPERSIKIGQNVHIDGALLGDKISINGGSSINHRPFTPLL